MEGVFHDGVIGMFRVVSRYSLLAITLIANNALSDWHAGGLYSFAIIDLGLPSGEEFSPSALMFKGGYDLHKYLSLEVRAGTGITEGKRSTSGIQRTIGINNVYGGYLKFQSGSPIMSPYILMGYTKSELELSNGTLTTSADDDGASYGLGIEGALSGSTYYNMEYVRYYSKDNVTIDGIGLGFTARY